jgi:hypothetical protein
LTEDVVKACHAAGQIVAVWIDASITTESIAIYKRLIDLKVDCFCSDFPLKITELRDKIIEEKIELSLLQPPVQISETSTQSAGFSTNLSGVVEEENI